MKTLFLLLFVLLCAGYDQKSFRIPNLLILAGAGCGTMIRLIGEGWGSVPDMAGGALIPAAICAVLFYFSMIGAADIKMLMVIGIFVGKGEIGRIMWYSLLIAAASALIKVIKHRMAFIRGFYLYDYVRRRLEGEGDAAYISKEEIRSGNKWLMHLAVPIAAAAIVWAIMSLL